MKITIERDGVKIIVKPEVTREELEAAFQAVIKVLALEE